MDNPTVQHITNAVPAAATLAALWARLPEVVTVFAGLGAIIWYAIIIAEKVVGWRAKWLQMRASARSVAQRIEEDRRPTKQKLPEAYRD